MKLPEPLAPEDRRLVDDGASQVDAEDARRSNVGQPSPSSASVNPHLARRPGAFPSLRLQFIRPLPAPVRPNRMVHSKVPPRVAAPRGMEIGNPAAPTPRIGLPDAGAKNLVIKTAMLRKVFFVCIFDNPGLVLTPSLCILKF